MTINPGSDTDFQHCLLFFLSLFEGKAYTLVLVEVKLLPIPAPPPASQLNFLFF